MVDQSFGAEFKEDRDFLRSISFNLLVFFSIRLIGIFLIPKTFREAEFLAKPGFLLSVGRSINFTVEATRLTADTTESDTRTGSRNARIENGGERFFGPFGPRRDAIPGTRGPDSDDGFPSRSSFAKRRSEKFPWRDFYIGTCRHKRCYYR